MPTNCQTETSARVVSAYSSLPSQGANRIAEADRVQHRGGDAPDRREDQLPGEADDHEGEDRRHEDRRAVERREAQPRMREDRGQRDADGVLHQHVDQEEPEIVAERVPERSAQSGSRNSVRKFCEPDEDALLVDLV
jgi:hypothetical protein